MMLTLYRNCFQVLFSDRTGEVCLLSEAVGNRALVVLGVHQHAMVLGIPEVRGMLPHLERFVQTGRMVPDEAVDWVI